MEFVKHRSIIEQLFKSGKSRTKKDIALNFIKVYAQIEICVDADATVKNLLIKKTTNFGLTASNN